jgi:hypothetical protein
MMAPPGFMCGTAAFVIVTGRRDQPQTWKYANLHVAQDLQAV